MKQFKVPNFYRSNLISGLKEKRKNADKLKKDFSPSLLQYENIQIFLARHFGFCYGVENAIEIAFKTIEENEGKRIFLLSEMIHNPKVNDDLKRLGVIFLQDTYGNELIPFDEITGKDVVIIPAFGTTLGIEEKLRKKGIAIEKYNTTCPFVEKVWNRSHQIAQKGYSIIVHGKPKHEETRATFSHASANTATIVISDIKETERLALYINEALPAENFYEEFKGRYSDNFDVNKDLQRIGVVNQTTQLASDTQGIADYLKQTMMKKYSLTTENVAERFADTRDTLCYATNDNQTAVKVMLESTPADLAIVVGGANSSNTSHLVEMCESVLPTFFIDNASKIIDDKTIFHTHWKTKEEIELNHFLPKTKNLKVLITSGASCPDAVVEEVIEKLKRICC
jgi:4-hydroxy-3-methylbut-2-en-1-yl diphosphate reductase